MPVTPNYDLDVDTSLGGSNASDYVVPSQKAIKTYVDNNGGSYTAGTGIDITNDVISVTSPTLTNTATGVDSVTILGNASSGYYAVNIGKSSAATGRNVALGWGSSTNASYSVALGAQAKIDSSIINEPTHQIGKGTNSEPRTLYVGFEDIIGGGNNYKMLDGTTGLIPDARISSNIARSADIPTVDQTYDASSTNAQSGVAVASAIDTVLAALYPVGSLYIGTQSTCPLATLISGSTWTLVSSGKALWTGDGTNANTTIAAGLPNIIGSIQMRPSGTSSDTVFNPSGAFTRDRNSSWTGGYVNTTSGATFSDVINFKASDSNSIYGQSSTVQPPAYVANIWRRTA